MLLLIFTLSTMVLTIEKMNHKTTIREQIKYIYITIKELVKIINNKNIENNEL